MTNFFSAQIYFSVHKYIFQCTNIFYSAHKNFIFQCTNIFSSAQIYFSVHKFIFQCTNTFLQHKYVFQCTNIFSSAQICNWRPGYHCLPAPNWSALISILQNDMTTFKIFGRNLRRVVDSCLLYTIRRD